MSPVEPARHEVGRDDDDTEGGEVIAFPGADASGAGAGAPVEVTETEPDPDGEVLVGEIVDDDRDDAGELERYEPAVAPAQIMRSYWRRTRPALRPDRLTWAIAKHELYYGTRGLAHGVPPLWRWVTAAELDQQLATNPQLVLETRKRRRIVLLSAMAGAGAGAAAAWVLVAPAAVVAAVLAVLTVAGAVERTRARAEDGGDAARLALGTDPSAKEIRGVVVDAKLAKAAEQVRVIGPVVRTEADNAWEATVELPAGTTYKQAVKRRGELAAAIGVDEVQVALDPVKGHNGRVRLWCADEDPMQGDRVINPVVARREAMNFWSDKVFAGRDPRGRDVDFSLVERSYLIGGEPGGGKSVASNNILAGVFLDPRTRVILADGKFGFDLMPWEPMAEHVLTDKTPQAMLDLLDWVITEEMDRRYALLRKLGVPKITEEIADKYDLHPIVLHIDEIQYWSASGEAKADKEFLTRIADIVGRGRAAGIVTGAITQRPAAEVVPTRLRDILSIRWALRCTTPAASDTVLGAGRASQGYSAAMFNADQRGAGFLLAEGAQPVQTRAAFIDPGKGELEAVARTAYRLREEAGTLPATADRPEVRLLTAVMEAMGGEHKGAHTADLLPALAKVSGEYQEWDGARLAAALRPLGVAPVQLDIGGRNRNGYRRADVAAALERV